MERNHESSKKTWIQRLPVIWFGLVCVAAALLGACLFLIVGLIVDFAFGIDAPLFDFMLLLALPAIGALVCVIFLIRQRRAKTGRRKPPRIVAEPGFEAHVGSARTSPDKEKQEAGVNFRFCDTVSEATTKFLHNADLARHTQADEAGATFQLSKPSSSETGNSTGSQRRDTDQWFYSESGKSYGPISTDVLIHLIKSKKLSYQTLIWRSGMSEWLHIQDTELKDALISDTPASPLLKLCSKRVRLGLGFGSDLG
jgi:GYF domain 2